MTVGIAACDASDDETLDAEHGELNCVTVETDVAMLVVVRIEENRALGAEPDEFDEGEIEFGVVLASDASEPSRRGLWAVG